MTAKCWQESSAYRWIDLGYVTIKPKYKLTRILKAAEILYVLSSE